MSGDRGDRFSRLSDIISDAPRTSDPAALSQWLDTACGGDEWLRTQAAELLEHRGDMPSEFLAAPRADDVERQLPERIGPFTVTGRLGKGGMGEVFVGHDAEADRDVAIKVVLSGAPGQEVLARFEAERRMLARMDHPGIARVWSVGRTDQQQPWLAMELVPAAVNIVAHAEQEHLGLRDRVELMARVCDAVHHAHQKGVVHRDVKPGNIVISADDPGQPPWPRVIDFGVARLVDEAGMLDFRTRAGQLIGTKAYMAPEQARDPAAADVRSDVFALGTVLYELVTGRRAFTSAGGPPATPPIDAGGPLAIPPDLNLIIMTAIAEDPALRYGSAEALAADLRRLLANEPILARPPTSMYVVRKFVRRHRPAVAISVAALIALVATTVLATDQAIRATRAEAATQRFAYRAGLVAAASAIRDRDAVAAAAFLDGLPEASRDWEWRLLDRQARGYTRRLASFDVHVETIAFDADGRIFVQQPQSMPFTTTEEPQARGDMVLLPGTGLSVSGRRAVSWGNRDIRVVDTGSGRSLRLDRTSFEIVAATADDEAVITLAEDAILRRRSGGASDWVAFSSPVPFPATESGAVRLTALDDGNVLITWSDGFVVMHQQGIVRDVRFPGSPSSAAPAVSRDGSRVAALPGGNRIMVLDVASGHVLHEVGDLPEPGMRIALDETAGRVVVADGSGALHVADLTEERLLGGPRLGHVGPVTALTFAPGDRVLTADFGGSILEWAVGPGATSPAILAHAKSVMGVWAAPDGTVCTLSPDAGVCRWRPGEPEPEAGDPETVGGMTACILPADGLAWSRWDGPIAIRRGARVEEIPVFGRPHVSDLQCSPDGTRLAICHSLDGVAVVTLETGEVRMHPSVPGAWAAIWIDDVSLLIAESGALTRLDTRTGERRVLTADLKPSSLERLDGRRAFVGTYQGELLEVDVASGAVIRRIAGHDRSISAISVAPGARRVATGDHSGEISVRDVTDCQELLRLPATDTAGVLTLAWSPDGNALIAGFTDGRAEVWAVGPPWAAATPGRTDS